MWGELGTYLTLLLSIALQFSGAVVVDDVGGLGHGITTPSSCYSSLSVSRALAMLPVYIQEATQTWFPELSRRMPSLPILRNVHE